MKKTQDKDFDSSKINKEELQKYQDKYSEEGLLQKISKYGRLIGIEALYKALQLWYVLQKPEVPAKQKALIMGALGYLISPLDFIPDIVPVLGYTDDIMAVAFALVQVQGYIDDEVRAKAKALLGKFFSEEAVAKLN